jgi:hypothetical protein
MTDLCINYIFIIPRTNYPFRRIVILKALKVVQLFIADIILIGSGT